ncbi:MULTISPECIES: hypothetical protein [unclassified Rhodococcus (in: high G+C Gram-positive bacteria)]|uniref:hypothetical protein n=2 Tax=Mycobacteriales TaxID=85007 RepID=UPI000B9BECE0|nr:MULTISPECIES: hypothetical protein [unclassified Rhodococcus (in: high G+C Gram-positive bacteria)]OZE37812.1 hypothetical protein CH259_11680 [Rhodococcus sp. 05-2254-4]OZE40896.1 hypothetical protein CH261_26650 [Rhodococcus sp. 05-2254-3]OZE45935.1 hypothetical protein CH283_25305 [Rhodococcus sp. 05-2254-2]
MTPSNGGPISARERARRANAQRLSDAQVRLKNQEQDLISYFDATRDEQKINDDVTTRIERLRRDAETKLEAAYERRARALAELKKRGETYASIAALVDLSVPEATRLVKSTMTARTTLRPDIGPAAENDAGGTSSTDESFESPGDSASTASAEPWIDEDAGADEEGARSIAWQTS